MGNFKCFHKVRRRTGREQFFQEIQDFARKEGKIMMLTLCPMTT
jgi:hypothetical protein